MKNAIIVPTHHQWREGSSFRDLAHVLLHEVHLEGRSIKAHGSIAIDVRLINADEYVADNDVTNVTWLLIDEGLLLVHWPFDMEVFGYDRNHPSTLWIPDIRRDGSPLVTSCMRSIEELKTSKSTQEHEKRKDVNLNVASVLLLQNDLNLYAFPLEDTPEEHLLSDVKSEKLHALGIRFTAPAYSGYLDLYHFDLFIQGPDWCYSQFPWFKKEPRLAIERYAYLVLVSGKEGAALACDGSEKRECLFCGQFSGNVIDVIHRLVLREAEIANDSYETWFNPREVWVKAMKDWKVILEKDDWESLFETLCNPDYEQHTVDTSWLYLVNSCYHADYKVMKKALKYLHDWVEHILETEEGITAYCIW